MLRNIDKHTITDAAIEQMASTPEPRLKQVMESLVRHLHEFAREVDLTPEEWLKGIRFLTEVGRKCTAFRQEFILLSDTLGLSSLVNALHDKRAVESGTKTSLLGPFYRQDSPVLPLGASIVTQPSSGMEICLYGRVVDSEGRGIPNASIEIWQPDETGNYDLQKLEPSEMDLRGRFYAGAEGSYHMRTVCPAGYMVPMDGPVGNLIRAQKRHGYRPAHIHFLVTAPDCCELVTALYIAGDEHLDSDTVFGVTESLVTAIRMNDPASPIPNLPGIHYDFQLASASNRGFSGRVGADPSQIVKKALG